MAKGIRQWEIKERMAYWDASAYKSLERSGENYEDKGIYSVYSIDRCMYESAAEPLYL